MHKNFLLLLLFIYLPVAVPVQASDGPNLRCEYLEDPVGIERTAPRLSWWMEPSSGKRAQATTAYRILVASDRETLKKDQGDLWDTGRVMGPQPVCVNYAGKALRSFQRCFWKVKLWDEKSQAGHWSRRAQWTMGVVTPSDWQAQWITHTPQPRREAAFVAVAQWFDAARWIWHPTDNPNAPPPGTRQFRRVLSVPDLAALEWVEMIFTANDAFQLWVNGNALTSGPVVFDAAAQIPAFNIKPYLKAGHNEIHVMADKYAVRFANPKIRQVAGCIGVIKIKPVGKPVETIVTDAQWQSRKDEQDAWVPARDLAGPSTHWRRLPGWRQQAPSPVLCKSFVLSKPIRSAQVAISGLGYYELYNNGSRIGNHRLDPAFTDYDHRVLYTCYDMTLDLHEGLNTLSVLLGNGWYNMHTRATWNFDQASWRDRPKMILQLQVTFKDGSQQVIVSDRSWRARTGPILRDGVRNGEVYDARQEIVDWSPSSGAEKNWIAAELAQPPRGKLVSQTMPGIKVLETVPAVAITEPRPGIYVVDLGKNIAGWARIKVSGPAGTRVQLRYSERLDPDGMINQLRNRRYMYQGPFQTDTYILKGKRIEVWEPRFTYHGFRYIEVRGWPGTLRRQQIEGRFAHTAFDTIGDFACSNILLNTIYTLTDRAYRSNFVGYPTDCPQREKNGWTGDAHLATEQALFNYHNVNAYDKWLYDLLDARTDAGDLPGIVPTAGWGYSRDNGPGWGSAAVLIPWYLYQYTGDAQFLSDHLPLMRGYVDFLHTSFSDHIIDMGRGDWVFLNTRTPGKVTSTALCYADTRIVAESAEILGDAQAARHYRELAAATKQAYNQHFYEGNGVYTPGGQTAQAMSLFYDLVPESEKAACVAQLVKAVHRAQDHIDCGILGAKALFHVLSDHGHHELAYTIATQPDFPGYGDWIAQGASTLWEDWPDKEGSLNHVMFGDIVTWFYRSLAGIQVDPAEPGFRHVVFRPRPVADLRFARAQTQSPFGKIRAHWYRKGDQFTYTVLVPPNARATVHMPDGGVHRVASGEHRFVCAIK